MKRIVNVSKADMAQIHAKMSGTPYRANLALAVVSAVWTWAENRDEVPFGSNPCRRLERYPEKGRERFLTADELARLGDALRTTNIDHYAVLHAKWSEVDVERGVLFLADSKTGKKPIYLGAAALEVIAGLPRRENSPYLIPGALPGRPRADLHGPWRIVTKAAGLEGVRLHDLRHSFASIGAGASMRLPVIGKLLGHSQAATTHRYAHLDADPLRRAVDTIGATISAVMDGGRTGNVVALPKGKVR